MAIAEIKDTITKGNLMEIEEMAEQNYGPRDIARALSINVKGFLHIWRDPKSQIREAYELGRLSIDRKKKEQLIAEVGKGNITAIQIHDKHTAAQHFEDIKREIFSFE